jgi:hypothetical protein
MLLSPRAVSRLTEGLKAVGNNHWAVNCPDLSATQHDELAGMAHISVGKDILGRISLLQNESTNTAIIATRKSLTSITFIWTALPVSIKPSPRNTLTI